MDIEVPGLDTIEKAMSLQEESFVLGLYPLIRTEVSTTIFPAIAGISVISNDVGRIPLANPLLFELSQRGKSAFP